jgi:hypothetical protein
LRVNGDAVMDTRNVQQRPGTSTCLSHQNGFH